MNRRQGREGVYKRVGGGWRQRSIMKEYSAISTFQLRKMMFYCIDNSVHCFLGSLSFDLIFHTSLSMFLVDRPVFPLFPKMRKKCKEIRTEITFLMNLNWINLKPTPDFLHIEFSFVRVISCYYCKIFRHFSKPNDCKQYFKK